MHKPGLTRLIQLAYCVIFIGSLSLGSCKKDEPTKVRLLEKRVVAFCVFKQGSYWVYRNNQNPDLDTVRVVYHRRGITENPEDDSRAEDWESATMEFSWTSYPNHPQIGPPYRFVKAESFNASPNGVKTFVYDEYPWLMDKPYITFVHLDSVGHKLIEFNNIITLENIHETYQIEDSTYNDVWEFTISNVVFLSAPKSVFWARNIGMIKWISQDSAVIELMAYSVEQ